MYNQKAMLCGWIGGKEARYMEDLSDKEVGNTCGKLLRRFTGMNHIPLPIKVYK